MNLFGGLSLVATFLIYFFLSFCSSEQLNIHIIAHTHDDVGWLKTVDQYYIGSKQDVQNAGVQYILDTVIKALTQDPNRKFIYVEIAFFERWWREQTSQTKETVRSLVRSGQLEFINGGWCMNDEATAHYEDTIHQMTEGHDFLEREFGVRPTIGWQVDPFGHANAQADLFSQMGFDSVFFARIDYQDYQNRLKNKNLEFIWRPSQSSGQKSDIFAGVLWDTTYCYPPHFNFEGGDTPVQDDPRLFDYNVRELAADFASQMKERARYYRTPEILVTFGCDFNFQNADINFKNMDRLMKYINANSSYYGMTVKYSTPSIYTKAVHSYEIPWDVVTSDFFPYADNPYSFWTGYFTSRPALKGYVRTRSSIAEASFKLFTSFGGFDSSLLPKPSEVYLEQLDVLAQAQAVAQHHDAVSGTSKQNVADDYELRLSIGTNYAYASMSEFLSFIAYGNNQVKPSFGFCDQLNVSICDYLGSNKFPVSFTIYNPIAWDRNETIRLPVPFGNVIVLDSNGNKLPSQITVNYDVGLYNIVFVADIPAMGFASFQLVLSSFSRENNQYEKQPQGTSSISNSFFQVNFDPSNLLSSVVLKDTNRTVSLKQNFFYYIGSVGNSESSQASGAYIFRPNSSDVYTVSDSGLPQLEYTNGPIVSEARQTWNNWVKQTVRLNQIDQYIEFEQTIGPIPINDDIGKEVISSWHSSLNTNQEWETDSEGMELQLRKLNYRSTWNLTVEQPVAGNYYPAHVAVRISDEDQDLSLSFVTDRSCGVSSLTNGQVEIMVHRRLLVDDSRGVGEPLNETTTIKTFKRLSISPVNSTQGLRKQAILLNHPVIIGFSTIQNPKYVSPVFRPLTQSLPNNVHLTTFKTTEDNLVLVRLHHIYGVGEDAELSKSVTVDLSTLFTHLTPLALEETTLTGNLPVDQLHRLQWKTRSAAFNPFRKNEFTQTQNPFVISLSPMQIRTFLVRFAYFE